MADRKADGSDPSLAQMTTAALRLLQGNGKGVAVPPWAADGDTDRRLADYAEKVMALSKGIEETVAKIVPEMT